MKRRFLVFFLLVLPNLAMVQNLEKHNYMKVKLNQCMVPTTKKTAPELSSFLLDTAIYIDTVSQKSSWKIDFYWASGFKQVIGQEPDNYFVYAVGNKFCKFSFKDILEKFEIGEPKFLLPHTDLSPNENHRFTRSWYFFRKGEKLVLRAVSNYPNGNMTSWFHESMYVFKPAS